LVDRRTDEGNEQYTLYSPSGEKINELEFYERTAQELVDINIVEKPLVCNPSTDNLSQYIQNELLARHVTASWRNIVVISNNAAFISQLNTLPCTIIQPVTKHQLEPRDVEELLDYSNHFRAVEISWDLDNTLFARKDSAMTGNTVLNESVLQFRQDFAKKFKGTINNSVLTARTSNARQLAESRNAISLLRDKMNILREIHAEAKQKLTSCNNVLQPFYPFTNHFDKDELAAINTFSRRELEASTELTTLSEKLFVSLTDQCKRLRETHERHKQMPSHPFSVNAIAEAFQARTGRALQYNEDSFTNYEYTELSKAVRLKQKLNSMPEDTLLVHVDDSREEIQEMFEDINDMRLYLIQALPEGELSEKSFERMRIALSASLSQPMISYAELISRKRPHWAVIQHTPHESDNSSVPSI